MSGDSDNTDPVIGDAVGMKLKAMFDTFARETVPDKFVDLIKRLEAVEAAEKDAKIKAEKDSDT